MIESVTGGAHYTHPRRGWRTFSINARKYEDESVDGMFQVNNHGVGSWFKGVIACFSIEGNQAWLGGVVTSTNQVLEPGAEKRVLWVQDNGEGTTAEPDLLRGIPRLAPTGFGTLEEYCEARPEPPEWTINELEAGNVQIKH